MIIPECDLHTPMSPRLKIALLLLCVVVLGTGIFAAVRFVQTRLVATKRPMAKIAPLVETIRVRVQTSPVIIHTLGNVIPARQTSIRPEVAGVVREVGDGFLPGGVIPAGKTLLRLDPEEYLLTMSSKEAELQRAKAELDLELGFQQVARHEWALLQRNGSGIDNPDLALRKPQLAQAKAKVRQAEAAADQARLDLKRTTVSAPFTALVMEKNAEVGTRVTTQDVVAVLVDAREYWVQGTIPVDRLAWINFPGPKTQGSTVQISSQASGASREGKLLKLRPDLESEGRMARFLAVLPAPLETRPAPIMLGEYVRLEIQGRTLENVVSLPRTALRDGDTVWAVRNATLDIRPVEVAWRDTETVLVSRGLSTDDMVITSALSTPIQGMSVTVATDVGTKP